MPRAPSVQEAQRAQSNKILEGAKELLVKLVELEKPSNLSRLVLLATGGGLALGNLDRSMALFVSERTQPYLNAYQKSSRKPTVKTDIINYRASRLWGHITLSSRARYSFELRVSRGFWKFTNINSNNTIGLVVAAKRANKLCIQWLKEYIANYNEKDSDEAEDGVYSEEPVDRGGLYYRAQREALMDLARDRISDMVESESLIYRMPTSVDEYSSGTTTTSS